MIMIKTVSSFYIEKLAVFYVKDEGDFKKIKI